MGIIQGRRTTGWHAWKCVINPTPRVKSLPASAFSPKPDKRHPLRASWEFHRAGSGRMDEPISPRRTTPTRQTKIRVHSVPQNGVGLVSRGVALLPAANEVIGGFLWLCVNDDGQECFQDKVQSDRSRLRTPPPQDGIGLTQG